MVEYKQIKEGFWKSSYEPHLPMPTISDKPVDNLDKIIYKFIDIQNILDYGTFDNDSYILFDCQYSFLNIQWDQYMGYSNCRFNCGIPNSDMGNTTIKITYNNTIFEFPNGYIHYIKNHNVHPSPEFCDMILNFEPKKITTFTKKEKFIFLTSLNISKMHQGDCIIRYK